MEKLIFAADVADKEAAINTWHHNNRVRPPRLVSKILVLKCHTHLATNEISINFQVHQLKSCIIIVKLSGAEHDFRLSKRVEGHIEAAFILWIRVIGIWVDGAKNTSSKQIN